MTVELRWQETGPDEDPAERLTAEATIHGQWAPALSLHGVAMHVEAYRVQMIDHVQVGDGPWAGDALTAIYDIDEGDGPRHTFTYKHAQYIIVAYPYCD
jgi:hypothetical protein